MTSSASTQDLLGWRMRALGLWQPIPGAEAPEPDPGTAAAGTASDRAASGRTASGADRAHAVAAHLFALQGQDWNSARWALGVRAPGITDADVLAAFDEGRLVRSWPMRGTIHVMPAEDLGWVQAVTNHRVLPGAVKRRAFLGLDDATLAKMTDIALERLAGGKALSRDELGEAWQVGGVGDSEKGLGQWRYHVIWWLSQNGLIVAGPVGSGGTEPKFRLTEEWITAPRCLEGEEALAELAHRFARGRGPILERDLAWWTGLTVREARSAITAAASAGTLERVEVEGIAHWAEPELLAGPSGAAGASGDAGVGTNAHADRDPSPSTSAATAPGAHLLLPAFDEHLLGYTERGAVLAPGNFERIVPGRNGMFRATVVECGRVIGVWTKKALTGRTRLLIEPFPGERVSLKRLEPAAEAWGAFQGTGVELVRGAA